MIHHFLSVHWNVDPELFTIGVFRIGYYNLLFVSGFIIGYFIIKKMFKWEHLETKILENLLYTAFFSAAIGARLGHCLFYDPAHYLSHPIEILKVWEGGLASHGGTIGVLIGVWLYVRKYGPKVGFNYIWLLDRVAIPTALAACFIRLGNLMNSEIYGVETSLPWGFIFERRHETVPMHPTQIYEALCYLFTFFFLLWLYKKFLPKLKTGMIVGIFLILVFTSRFFIEFIKNTQVPFENGMTLDMGQWLSIPFILLGAGLFVYGYLKGAPSMLPQRAPVVPPQEPKSKPIGHGSTQKDGNRLGKKRRG
jgi:prolipoprotein diacylglyceryl transferase